MSEKTVVITESDGRYHIQNNGIPEFTLIGILECIVFDLKNATRQELASSELASKDETPSAAPESVKESAPQAVSSETSASKTITPPLTSSESVTSSPIVPQSNASELRTRISNAVKAIKGLGGDVGEFDADAATDEELQEELAELTEQYKRLKNSKSAKK